MLAALRNLVCWLIGVAAGDALQRSETTEVPLGESCLRCAATSHAAVMFRAGALEFHQKHAAKV